MTTRSRRIGADWEVAVMKGLREQYGEKVERLRLAGRDDEGDLAIEDDGLYLVVECKAEKEIDLSGYMREALRERDNYAKARGLDPADCLPMAIVKARGKAWNQAYVVMPLAEYFQKGRV